MLIVDRRPLDNEALQKEDHPLHGCAVEVKETLDFLGRRYKNGFIRFKKIGYPKYTKGADSNFREIPKVAEPVTPWRIPLKAYVDVGGLGKHTWQCCLEPPEVLPNGLYDFPKLSNKKSISVKEDILVNINDQPDLAFFLYRISKFMTRTDRETGKVTKGLFNIVDPIKDDEEVGVEEMALAERKYAIWTMLKNDVDKLKVMARAYNVADVDNKQPNSLRKELEQTLLNNDNLKRQNPAVRGTKEFMEEMKVTDNVLLRSFIQSMLDAKRLGWTPDGWYFIGSKKIVQVPQKEITRSTDYLCSYLMAGSNGEKLQEFMKDLLSKEYLDGIKDTKEWKWLASIGGYNPAFKKIEEIQEEVKKIFCPI